jgi:hypothetical protein
MDLLCLNVVIRRFVCPDSSNLADAMLAGWRPQCLQLTLQRRRNEKDASICAGAMGPVSSVHQRSHFSRCVGTYRHGGGEACYGATR